VEAFPYDAAELPQLAIPVAQTLEGFLDLRWIALDDEHAEVRFAVRDALRQPLGLLHGGVYSAVAETIASVATVRAVWPDGFTASGLRNSAQFLRPVTDGSVRVSARCRHRDDREWLWSHEFHDDRQRLCAIVDVTIAVRRPR